MPETAEMEGPVVTEAAEAAEAAAPGSAATVNPDDILQGRKSTPRERIQALYISTKRFK